MSRIREILEERGLVDNKKIRALEKIAANALKRKESKFRAVTIIHFAGATHNYVPPGSIVGPETFDNHPGLWEAVDHGWLQPVSDQETVTFIG